MRNAFSQSHDITLTTGGENSSTRLSVGANLQEGIINKTGMDKYNVSLYNSYKLFDGDVNLQTRVLYSDIDDLSHLTTNSAGYIGNLIRNPKMYSHHSLIALFFTSLPTDLILLLIPLR